MSKFTKKSVLQAGKEKRAGLNMSPQQARIAKARNIVSATHKLGLMEQHGLAATTAIQYALLAGEWNTEEIMFQLVTLLDNDGFCIREVIETLIAADILKWHNKDGTWVAGFRETFLEEYTAIEAMGIEKAPAKLLPLRKVDDWVSGSEPNMNIHFIKNSDIRVLNKIPASVINSSNKLQRVKYKVNPVLLPHLIQVWNTNNVADTIAKTQIDLQIRLLKELSKEDKAVQFLITSDYRGRAYYRGGLVTPQGPDFCKAAFQYKKAVKLGEHGNKYLAIHYANVYGLDKQSIADRLDWAANQGKELAFKIAHQSYFPTEADKPYQTIVAAYDWFGLMNHVYEGNPASSYKSRLVVHSDGSCNGLQHGSALMRCKTTAAHVNACRASENDIPRDAYRAAAEAAENHAQSTGNPEVANVFRRNGRKAFKQAVMITTYGSKQQIANVYESLNTADRKLVMEHKSAFEKAVIVGIGEVASVLMTLNQILQGAIEDHMATGPKAIFWKTSDGFPVMQAKRSETEGVGLFTYRTKDIDEGGQKRAISANFIHSMDADHMRAVVNAADFPMTTVHDSYGCHAGNMARLLDITREKFSYIHKYDYVASLNKLSNLDIELPVIGDYDLDEAKEATYLFS